MANLIVLDEQIAVGFKATAGGWSTGIVPLSGGLESRNQNWLTAPRRRYDFAYQGRTKTQLQTLMAFFDDRRGALHPWLLKDFLNFELTNETILTAAGGETTAQVKQTWGPDNAFARNVGGIKLATFVLKKNGVTLSGSNSPPDYVLNTATGAITGLSALSAADVLTVTTEYYVKVRFEQDSMMLSADAFNATDRYIGGGSTSAIEVLS